MPENSVIEYCKKNTEIEIQDAFKYLYQSCFGCEHLVSDYSSALERIRTELQEAESDDLPEIEPLDGDFCRVHLKICGRGVSPEELCRLFLLSSERQPDGLNRLRTGLNEFTASNENPFSYDDTAKAVNRWQNDGFPAVHHSERFRTAHHPAYRVIKKEFLKFL